MSLIKLEEIIEKYNKKGYKLYNVGELKSGKEATIYVAGSKFGKVALKVYKNPTLRKFQKDQEYIEGKYYRNPMIRRAIQARTKFGKEMIFESWVRREFFLLNGLNQKQANVPKVYDWYEHSILMEFIGDNLLAPQLIDVQLTTNEAKLVLETLLKNVEVFLDFGIVHSDLSPYNILWWKGQPVIIDFPQAIDIRNNPNKQMLLKRDLDNLINYFENFIGIDNEAIYSRFFVIPSG